jgi:hypothetical protein
MRIFYWGKDGGYESTVWGFWLVEIKWLFSIVLLRFEPGTRAAYHDHAFNAISWLLRGRLLEFLLGHTGEDTEYRPSWWPIVTRRSTFHQVNSVGRSWVLSFRGPWSPTWREYAHGGYVTLKHGRQVAEAKGLL